MFFFFNINAALTKHWASFEDSRLTTHVNIIHRQSLRRIPRDRWLVSLCTLIAAFDVTKNFLFALNSVNGVRYSTRFDARLRSRRVEPEIGRSSVTQRQMFHNTNSLIIYPQYDRIAIRGLNSKRSFVEDLYAINWADLELGFFCSRDLSRVLHSQFGWQERVEVPNFAYHRVVACESSEHVGIWKENVKEKDKSTF